MLVDICWVLRDKYDAHDRLYSVQKIQLIIVVVCLLGGMDCVTPFDAESLNYRLMHESRSVIE